MPLDQIRSDLPALARTTGLEVLAFLLAARCPGCESPGTLLCEACRAELAPGSIDLRTPAGLCVRAALSFDGVRARCIRTMKDEGETLLARPLGAALAASMADYRDRAVGFVPVPTSVRSMRRRGYRVTDLLIRRAGENPLRVLADARRRRDQRGLGVGQRERNVRGTMRARAAGSGREVVVVDDVMTTGATLDEAARALDAAGFLVRSAVVLAATPRHSER